MQLTRQRQKRSLDRTLLAPCAACSGSGRVKSAETLAHAILRRIRQQHAPRLTLRAHPEIAGLVGELLLRLEREGRGIDCRVAIVEDAALARDAFELGALAPGA